MPYSLTLPNGFVVNNIPDDVPRAQALENLKVKMPDAFPPPPGIGEQLLGAPKAFVKGIGSSLATTAGGLGGLLYGGARFASPELAPFSETGFGRAITGAEEYFAPSDEGFITQVAGGLGSFASILGPQAALRGLGAAGRFAGLAPKAATPVAVAQTTGLGAGEARQRVEISRGEGIDVTPGEELAALSVGVPIGLLELLPVERLLGGLSKSLAGDVQLNLANYIKRAFTQGGVEGAQEVASGLLQDLSAKGIYNPNLEVGESMLNEFAVGSTVGAIAQTGLDVFLRKDIQRAYQNRIRNENEDRIRKETDAFMQQESKEIAQTKQNLGIQDGKVLALPKPAPQVDAVEKLDPLMNPTGFFNANELTPEYLKSVNDIRDKEGKTKLSQFSIEDIADAGAPQAEIDRLLTYKTGYDGKVSIEPSDIFNIAETKNIDATTPGFADFLTRTTGQPDVSKMSPPQLFAAFKALDAVEGSDTLQILPQGTNAIRFTQQQYDKSIKSLTELFPKTNLLGKSSVVQEIKDFSGLESDRDAESLLQTAIRKGDLDTVSTRRYDVVDQGGKTVRTYLTRESANRAAVRENLSVRESTSINIALPGSTTLLPGGPDIRKGTFQDGVAPAGFEIRSPEAILTVAKTQDEADAKAVRLEKIRLNKANGFLGQAAKVEQEIDKSNQKLESMEADGKADTLEYKKLAAKIAVNNKNLEQQVDRLKAKANAFSQPLEIAPKGERPVTREGFTLFQEGKPVATFPDQQRAEEAALATLSDEQIDGIISQAPGLRGLAPKRLRTMALDEKTSRQQSSEVDMTYGPRVRPIGVAFTGDRAEAEQRLRDSGIDVKFSPEIQAKIDELEKKLRPLMDRLGLKDVRLKIVESIKSPVGEANASYVSRLVTVALNSVKNGGPIRALRHEGIHALKELGFFTPQQLKVLEKKAKEVWLEKYDIANRYQGLGLNQEQMIEEAIADAFSDFDQTKSSADLSGAMFRKVKNFLEGLRNALNGLGFQTADDVFTRTEQGRLTGPGTAVAGETKFSLAKVLSQVSNDIGLTDAELAATSLGLQTGKGGTKAFKEQKVGGIKNIIEFLENRYRESGLPPLNINSEEDRETLSKLLSAEALAAIRSGGANIEWYNQVIDKMLGMASLKYPELRSDPNAQAAFRIAIAVSSQGMNVEDNLKFGERVYEQFHINYEEGVPRFPEIGTGESLAAMKNNFRTANLMIEKMGMDDFRRFLETPFTANELNAVGLKVDELADEQVLGSSIFGPKIGFGFYSNLTGNFDPVTMDMWFMRTIGRLIGKLREFDPAKYQSQIDRFRSRFGINGDNGIYANQFSREELENAIADEQTMIGLARKVKSLHEKDFKNNRSLFDSGQRVKTDFVKSAENIIKSLDAPKDAPANGTERRLLRDVVRRMREKVANVTGQDIPPASLQAIIWYPEQELYKALGAKLRVTSQNYADSMRKLLREEGFDERRISAAAQSGSRRARRADERDVAAGLGEADRRAGRALSPEAREDFLETERERIFFEGEIEQPRARTLIFEVAPNPDDVQAMARWNQLSPEQKTKISKDVIDNVLPKAMEAVGIQGYLTSQIGSYENDTNPSFGLFVKKGSADQIVELAKMLGYAFSQKSMVVASPKETKGLDKNGAIRIPVGNIDIQKADQIYQRLRAIRVNGKPILDGQTTVHGQMVIMNFYGLTIEEFAEKIHNQLNGEYNVTIDDVYSSLIEEKDYKYGDPKSDPRGNRGVLRERSRALRTEASNLLDQKINEAGKFSLRSDESIGGPSIGSGISIRPQQPTAQSFDVVHYGKQRVENLLGSMYGTGIKGAEASRVFNSDDPRVKQRAYFYIPFDNGRMPKPEAGLGQEVHVQRLNNLLGPGPEMRSLASASRTPDGQFDENVFESSVIDAGYDGYAVPNMGMAVVLGSDVPVVSRGTRQEVEARPDKDKIQIGDRKYSLRQTNTPEFKQFFGDSKIVNADGTPKVMYHGTARDITEFRPKQADAIFVTDSPTFAESFADASADYLNRNAKNILTEAQFEEMQSQISKIKDIDEKDIYRREFVLNVVGSGPNIIPLYVRAENPFDYENPQNVKQIIDSIENPEEFIKTAEMKSVNNIKGLAISLKFGEWNVIEHPMMQSLIKASGFDSFYVREGGIKNLAVYKPNQIKSAIGNFGAFSRTSDDIRYSLSVRDSVPVDIAEAIDRTTTRRENKGFADRMVDSVSPKSFTEFRAGFVNRYDRIEKQSIEVADSPKDLLADQSAIAAVLFADRAAGVAAASFGANDRVGGIPVYRNGFTQISNENNTVKGVIPIFEPLAQFDDPYVFQAFQYYSGTRRGKRLLAEGREKLFTPDDIKRGKVLERQYPEFKQIFDEYQKYNEGMVKYLQDTGVLSAKEASIWMENSDYIPFYRQMEGEAGGIVGPRIFSPIAGVVKPKKLKGGEAPLADFLETVVRNSRAAIEAGMKNVAGQRVVRDMLKANQAEAVPPNTTGLDIITVKENGLTKHYRVADPLLVEALKGLNLPNLPFLEILAMPAQLLRNLVTKEPGFMLANLTRDSLQAWVTTGIPMVPLFDTFKQFGKAIANMSPEAQALANAGLFAGYDFSGDVKSTSAEVERALRERTGTRTTIEKAARLTGLPQIWNALDKGSTASDVATRAEVYKRVLAETGNQAEAMYQAMEVMNFSRKGNSALIRIVTALVPFMNARIQGLDVLYRSSFGKMATATRERQQKAFMTRGLTLFALSSMYWAMASDTEEYKTATPEARDNNWIIGSVRIPIPFEIGTIFKVFPERIYEYFFGMDTGRDLKDSVIRNITSTLAFNPIPQAFIPVVENVANYSFFTGQPIVGRGAGGIYAPFQASPSTSLLAQQVADATGQSPMMIDNLIRGYTGTIGTYVVQALDAVMRGEGDPTKAAMTIEQFPVLKRFFATPQGGGTIDAYYNMKQRVDEATTTINFLERTGGVKDLQEYLSGKGGKLLTIKPYIQAMEKDMKVLRDMRRGVQVSRIDEDQKRQILDSIRKSEVAITSRIQYIKKIVD